MLDDLPSRTGVQLPAPPLYFYYFVLNTLKIRYIDVYERIEFIDSSRFFQISGDQYGDHSQLQRIRSPVIEINTAHLLVIETRI